MYIMTQFSIFMVNKPGILAQTLDEFAKNKINLIAISMMDSAESGVMRAIFEDPKKAMESLKKLNMPYDKTDVLCVTLTNKPGALAVIVEKLSKAHVNISYAYCTAGAKGGKTTGVLKVADVKKAMKVLKNRVAVKTKKSKAVLRRPKTSSR